MNKKITILVGAVIFVIIAATAGYFIKKAKDINSAKKAAETEALIVQDNKEKTTEGNVLPPLGTVEGTVLEVTPERVLMLKDKLGQRNITVPTTAYIYAMSKGLPEAKDIAALKKGASVVVQLMPGADTQEASSVFIK